jgi:GTPase SAR1 family protein
MNLEGEKAMLLVETLAIEVGSSIAKSVLKLWLKDYNVVTDASSSIIDMLKDRTSDRLAQRKAQRQFEEIGERVGQSLLPLFEFGGASLEENDRIAIAIAVADTLNTTTSEVIAKHNLEPTDLARHLLKTCPAKTYHFNDIEALLYDRIIIESCTYIVDIASQLPTFTEQTFAEVLKRETQILEKVDQVLREVQRMREQQDPQEESARFELDYRRAVGRNLDVLELFGANVKSSSREQSLSLAYVRLSVEQKTPEISEQSIQSRIKNSATDPYLKVMAAKSDVQFNLYTKPRSIVVIDEALAQSQRLIIRGLAGSGKTTLLQWVAVNAAAKTFQESLKSWNSLLPFYIRLRHHVKSELSGKLNLPSPEEFPYLISRAVANATPKGWVREKLSSGRAIVLVDGVDEVPEVQRVDVRAWLKDLIEEYPAVRYIITSRPAAIGGDYWIDWMDSEGFQDALLQPMSLIDIFEFIDHWHNAVAKRLDDDQEKADLPHFAQHLKEELELNRAKLELATSPLLCALLCALNRDRRQQLPSDRIKLYEACCELLIEQRDKSRNVLLKDYPAAVLEYSQKLLLLQDLAYWMIKNGWSEVGQEQVDERFMRKMQSIRNLPQQLSDEDGGTYIRKFFVERASIIREPLVGHIDFTHRTFQEFLAAGAILGEGDIGVLVQHAHNDQWREVVLLVFGLGNKKIREELISKLCWQGDTDNIHRTRLHLLAASCLETSIEELSYNIRQEVQKRFSALIPPKNANEAKDLATAGELAVPYLVRNNKHSPEIRAACVLTLASIGGSAAFDILEEYTNDTCLEVIENLWQAWNFFEGEYREAYVQQVLSHMTNGPKLFSLSNFTSFNDFLYFTQLTNLSLTNCQRISDLAPLSTLTQLTTLDLGDCQHISDLAPLSTLTQLTTLSLSNCEKISDLAPLSNLAQLTTLSLSNCSIADLKPLSSLTQLTTLDLSDCQEIRDLAPLSNLTQLTNLNLNDCQFINSLMPCPRLIS